jgi:hypothetical protein
MPDLLRLLDANARSFSRRSGREFDEDRHRQKAGVGRPGFPIASVPTGTPPGIWTIDSSESSP